jgi:cytochrome P450
MRIARPSPESRIALDKVNLADTDLYTKRDAHLVWQTLRAERPVFWQELNGGRGFWAVTRRADVHRVLSEYETFSSEGGTAIAMLDAPDPAAGIMMHSSDPPRHRAFRDKIGRPFSPREISAYSDFVRAFVKKAIEPARDGDVWDVAAAFVRLPMAVGGMMMGLPEEDIDPLLRLAYASLAPDDPRYKKQGAGKLTTAAAAHYEIIAYFSKSISCRRKNPTDDLISYLIDVEIAGKRMNDAELLSNCLSLLLGAVVTTSHAINATMIALTELHSGQGYWPDHTAAHSVVEEALRWSSPVIHFMRRARRDTEVCGQKIAAGDAVTAWIASANRDENAFERPYDFDFQRTPNRHVAFGAGPHTCLGSHLARLMLRTSFEELSTSIETFELAEAPVHLVSNEIAGVVSLPLRIKLRARVPLYRPSSTGHAAKSGPGPAQAMIRAPQPAAMVLTANAPRRPGWRGASRAQKRLPRAVIPARPRPRSRKRLGHCRGFHHCSSSEPAPKGGSASGGGPGRRRAARGGVSSHPGCSPAVPPPAPLAVR